MSLVTQKAKKGCPALLMFPKCHIQRQQCVFLDRMVFIGAHLRECFCWAYCEALLMVHVCRMCSAVTACLVVCKLQAAPPLALVSAHVTCTVCVHAKHCKAFSATPPSVVCLLRLYYTKAQKEQCMIWDGCASSKSRLSCGFTGTLSIFMQGM